MFVNLDLYRVFHYVARLGSISRASEELYVSQPAVSQSIKRLEEQLECAFSSAPQEECA